METPDKIYATYGFSEEGPSHGIWYPYKSRYANIEYLRKDIVDETIKTAEDHAFFAGQEKFREKILEWVKKQASIIEKLNDKGARLKAWNTLIDKLNSL